MAEHRKVATMPAEMVRRVLESSTMEDLLVGGQALAYWMGIYNIHIPDDSAPAVSRDVDFFTRNAANTAPLQRFARAIGGRSEVNNHHNLSVLIGCAIASAPDDHFYLVDLIHSVNGIRSDRLEENAVTVTLPDSLATLRVMHPLDVLQSRNVNLHVLVEKQNEVGQMQFRLAIEVARAYLEEHIVAIAGAADLTDPERNRAVADAISAVQDYSRGDAAKKNAERYGIHLADAIPAWRIESDEFWEKQWSHLRERMSVDYADHCEALADRGSSPSPP